MFNQNTSIVVGESTTKYGLISVQGGTSVRSNEDATIGTPDLFTISHETKGKGAAAVDRHMVRIDTTKAIENSDGSIGTATATAYVVLIAPHAVVTKADVAFAFAKLEAFLVATEAGATKQNLQRVLGNEP